jgi:hypothetical protein
VGVVCRGGSPWSEGLRKWRDSVYGGHYWVEKSGEVQKFVGSMVGRIGGQMDKCVSGCGVWSRMEI